MTAAYLVVVAIVLAVVGFVLLAAWAFLVNHGARERRRSEPVRDERELPADLQPRIVPDWPAPREPLDPDTDVFFTADPPRAYVREVNPDPSPARFRHHAYQQPDDNDRR